MKARRLLIILLHVVTALAFRDGPIEGRVVVRREPLGLGRIDEEDHLEDEVMLSVERVRRPVVFLEARAPHQPLQYNTHRVMYHR